MIYIKSQQDIELIKHACKVWKETKQFILDNVKVGISKKEIDDMIGEFIRSKDCIPSCLNYDGFPSNVCISVNDELIHGVANNYVFKDKDLITFDVCVTYKGHIADSAFSVILGTNKEAQKILDAAIEALEESVKIIAPGVKTGDIGYTTSYVANKHGYEVIKEYSGHGCGNHMHEDPQIFNWGVKGTGNKLVKNMVICIEPMLMTGSDKWYTSEKDGWTVIASNHKLTCHCEYMILVTEDGYENLTK